MQGFMILEIENGKLVIDKVMGSKLIGFLLIVNILSCNHEKKGVKFLDNRLDLNHQKVLGLDSVYENDKIVLSINQISRAEFFEAIRNGANSIVFPSKTDGYGNEPDNDSLSYLLFGFDNWELKSPSNYFIDRTKSSFTLVYEWGFEDLTTYFLTDTCILSKSGIVYINNEGLTLYSENLQEFHWGMASLEIGIVTDCVQYNLLKTTCSWFAEYVYFDGSNILIAALQVDDRGNYLSFPLKLSYRLK